MRAKLIIIVFTFLQYFGISQISNWYVAGVYGVQIVTYNCSQLTNQTGVLYLTAASNYIEVKDSSYTTHAVFVPSIYAQVNPDSTFHGYTSTNLASGKYFPGDSIHLAVHYQFSITDWCMHEYFGKRISFTGIEDLKLLNSFITVSPQPANDFLNISFPNDAIKKAPILFDMNGKSINLNFVKDEGNYKAVAGELASGIYFLSIETTAGALRKKIVVVH